MRPRPKTSPTSIPAHIVEQWLAEKAEREAIAQQKQQKQIALESLTITSFSNTQVLLNNYFNNYETLMISSLKKPLRRKTIVWYCEKMVQAGKLRHIHSMKQSKKVVVGYKRERRGE